MPTPTPQWNTIIKDCVQEDGVATLNCIPAIFLNIVNALLMFAGTFALFLFFMSGFRYMNSGGDSKKIEAARNNLIYAAVGLLIVLFSFSIIKIISVVTRTDCITKFGFGC